MLRWRVEIVISAEEEQAIGAVDGLVDDTMLRGAVIKLRFCAEALCVERAAVLRSSNVECRGDTIMTAIPRFQPESDSSVLQSEDGWRWWW